MKQESWSFTTPTQGAAYIIPAPTDPRGQPTRTLMAQTVSTTPAVNLGVAIELFGGSSAASIDSGGYDVAPDGRRFLTLKHLAQAPGEGKRLIWMQNWPAAVKK